MYEGKLYSWTLKFHKVVRQQNLGAVDDFILPYSAVYLWIQKWKNYWNLSTFAKVIVKIKVAPYFMAHGVYDAVVLVVIEQGSPGRESVALPLSHCGSKLYKNWNIQKEPIALACIQLTKRSVVTAAVLLLLLSIYTVSQKKLGHCYFLNNSVKHWPTLIIFGMQHHKETWHKWP